MLTMDHRRHPVVEAVEGDADTVVRERGRRIKAAAELGLARSSRGRQWGRALGRRALAAKDAAEVPAARRHPLVVKKAARGDEQDAEEEEEVVVDEKVALLRRLVPGGDDMEVDGLLEETADYIAALKHQVGVMRALACMLSGAGIDALPEKVTHADIAPEQ